MVDVEGVGRQLAVTGDGFVQGFGRNHRGGGFDEGRFEVCEVRLRQAQARGHRVASETVDQARPRRVHPRKPKIGREACRERVCPSVSHSWLPQSYKTKDNTKNAETIHL